MIKNKNIKEIIMGILSWVVFLIFIVLLSYFFLFVLKLDDGMLDENLFPEYEVLDHQAGIL